MANCETAKYWVKTVVFSNQLRCYLSCQVLDFGTEGKLNGLSPGIIADKQLNHYLN